MIPIAASIETTLNILVGQALDQLEGVPDDDLDTWKPQQNLEDINTFYALATHLVGAGEYWVIQAVTGRPVDRDRPAEFQAHGDLASLKERCSRWLAAAHEVLANLTEDDLARRFVRDHDPKAGSKAIDWSVADCLIHAVEHTAVHVGHLQIQRQLWNAERG